ncbi:MAG: methyltransferase domain-containing protein [Phycisphaerales bacterium]|nr:methyltransferase domain-containing protein [Phycisphaerales bacterium]
MQAVMKRHRQPELMDDPAIDDATHRSALRRLDRINRVSLADRPIVEAILRCCPTPRPLRLLDVATGSGRVAISVTRRLAEAGHTVHLDLCDVSSTALAVAGEHARNAGLEATRIEADVTSGLPIPDQGVDVVMCSLFLHHLDEAEVVAALREFARVASTLVVVSDLRRCLPGYVAAWTAGVCSGSRIVRVDAPRSVEGAWTRSEFRSLCEAAGLAGVDVQRIVPYRVLVTWRREGNDL